MLVYFALVIVSLARERRVELYELDARKPIDQVIARPCNPLLLLQMHNYHAQFLYNLATSSTCEHTPPCTGLHSKPRPVHFPRQPFTALKRTHPLYFLRHLLIPTRTPFANKSATSPPLSFPILAATRDRVNRGRFIPISSTGTEIHTSCIE